MSNNLTAKQSNFIKNKTKGFNNKDSALLAGYSRYSAEVIGSKLAKNSKIITALEERGISDKYLARKLKTTINAGAGVKATASDSLHGIEIVSRLKGYYDNDKPDNMTQNNIYINELKMMTDDELKNKLDTIVNDIDSLKLASK